MTSLYTITHDFRDRAPTQSWCPACNGEGYTAENTGRTDSDGAPCEIKHTCDHCEGTGFNPDFDADDSGAVQHEVIPPTDEELDRDAEQSWAEAVQIFTAPQRKRVSA